MIQVEPNGVAALLRLEGNLVASVAEALRPALQGLVEEGVRTLIVDLARAEFVDSMGIGLLVAAHNTLEPAGGALVVVNVRPEVVRLLQTMRLDRHFSVRPAVPGKDAGGGE